MSGFVKIYGDKLLDSSVWVGTPKNVKILWVTLLALADQHGKVLRSLPGLAHRADLTRQETQEALNSLMAPDPHSQSKEHDGRRIIEMEGGWQLVTYVKHRDYRTEKQIKEAERKKRWREQQAGHVPPVPGPDVMRRPEAEAEAEAEYIYNRVKKTSKTSTSTYDPLFQEFWKAYPKRAGGNPKKAAYGKWESRLENGIQLSEDSERLWNEKAGRVLIEAAKRYAGYCDATGKTKTEYVKQAQYWLSPNYEGWKQDYGIPDEPMSDIGVADGDLFHG